MKETWTKRLGTARLFTVIAALLAIVCYFLPMYSATKDFADSLNTAGMFTELTDYDDMQPSELKHLSMFTYEKIYSRYGDNLFSSHTDVVVYIAIYLLPAALALLALLWAFVKKPILLLLNTILLGGTYWLILYDHSYRGLPGSLYVRGAAWYAYYAVIALLAIGAIWMKVCRSGLKRAVKKEGV